MGFRVQGCQGSGFKGLGFRFVVQGLGFRVYGSGFRVHGGSGFRVVHRNYIGFGPGVLSESFDRKF